MKKSDSKLISSTILILGCVIGAWSTVHAEIGVDLGAKTNANLGVSSQNVNGEGRADADVRVETSGGMRDSRDQNRDDWKNHRDDIRERIRTEVKSRVTTGKVTAVNESIVSIQNNRDGKVYLVDMSNAKIYHGTTVKTLADIKVGDNLIVEGDISGSIIMANRVLDAQIAKNAVKKETRDEIKNRIAEIRADGNVNGGFFARLGLLFKGFFNSKTLSDRPLVLESNATYRLQSYNGAEIPEGETYTLTLNNGNISAKFCNTMSGAYSLNEGKIVSVNLASTLMFCSNPERVMEMESSFGALLADGAKVSREGDTLTFTGSTGTTMVFKTVKN